MTQFLAAVLMLSTTVQLGSAQGRKNGLVLTGSVQSIRSECINGERIAAISLYLQFRNDSGSAVIFYPPSPMFDASIKYADSNSAVDTFRYNAYLINPWGSPTIEDYDPRLRLARKMDVAHPTEGGFGTIEAGGYYEFIDTIWPKSGFKIDFAPRKMPSDLSGNLRDLWMKQPCGVGTAVVTPEYRAFRIKYDLNLRKNADATDLLKNLQRRWRTFGTFILDRNDDISYETEEILLITSK